LPPSCALLGRFAIGARVALLWQHNANPSYKLASIPRYDDIVRTLGGRGWLAGNWPSTGGVLNITAAAWTAGFHGGVLATYRERKMLASTWLYSLYAWLHSVIERILHIDRQPMLKSPFELSIRNGNRIVQCCVLLVMFFTVRRIIFLSLFRDACLRCSSTAGALCTKRRRHNNCNLDYRSRDDTPDNDY